MCPYICTCIFWARNARHLLPTRIEIRVQVALMLCTQYGYCYFPNDYLCCLFFIIRSVTILMVSHTFPPFLILVDQWQSAHLQMASIVLLMFPVPTSKHMEPITAGQYQTIIGLTIIESLCSLPLYYWGQIIDTFKEPTELWIMYDRSGKGNAMTPGGWVLVCNPTHSCLVSVSSDPGNCHQHFLCSEVGG